MGGYILPMPSSFERAQERLQAEMRKRDARVVALRKTGKTYAEIASEYGLTRQRIEQIVNAATETEGQRA
jgi:predicted transcriptional regulator